MSKLEDYCTVAEVANRTGIKYKTLLQRVARGRLESTRINGIILIPTAVVEALNSEGNARRVHN